MKPQLYLFSKKTIALTVAILLTTLLKIESKSIIDLPSQPQEISTRIIPLLKITSDTLDEIRWSIGEIVLDNLNKTIDESGLYILGQDISAPMTIQSDNVVVDLNGYNILDNTGTTTAIIIEENLQNIVIKNGSLSGYGSSSSSSSGVLINSGSELIQVKDVSITGFEKGIFFEGTITGTVKSCNISNCIAHDNKKGFVLEYSIKSTFENCKALNCLEAGFELYKNQFNVFDKCKALETKNDNPNKNAIGFSCTSGLGNLFIECVANGTEKTSSNFCNSAKGFLLQGTSTEVGETKTEIVNCISSSSQSAGYGNAYGIHIDHTLKEASPLGTPEFTFSSDNPVNTISWSPESKYLAIGQDYVSTGSTLQILRFDDINITQFATADPNDQNISSISWSPNGDYLAVGTENDTDPGDSEFLIYKFDPNAVYPDFLTSVTTLDIGAKVNSISWSPNGYYIALGTNTGATDEEIQIWGYDGQDISLFTSVDKSSNVVGLDWSPDGKFLAAIYASTLEIFSFNPIAGTPFESKIIQTGSPLYSGSLRSIDWSPIAHGTKYILTIGGTSTGTINIQVLEYDGDSTLSSIVTTLSLGDITINSLKWSPNGKYILTAGERSSGYSADVLTFNASTPSLISNDKGDTPYTSKTCYWSPGGRYTVSAGQVNGGASGTTAIYESCNTPIKNIIKKNEVYNNLGGLCGIGIAGSSGNNLIIKNIGYSNNINFSYGIFNKFLGGLLGYPTNIQNISVPPYQD